MSFKSLFYPVKEEQIASRRRVGIPTIVRTWVKVAICLRGRYLLYRSSCRWYQSINRLRYFFAAGIYCIEVAAGGIRVSIESTGCGGWDFKNVLLYQYQMASYLSVVTPTPRLCVHSKGLAVSEDIEPLPNQSINVSRCQYTICYGVSLHTCLVG